MLLRYKWFVQVGVAFLLLTVASANNKGRSEKHDSN